MGLDDALIFTRVVEYHSFTQAAQSLGMQKSTVSRRIALLEERLGVRLLNRTTRKLRLTEVGQAYYERCRQIMHDFAEAEQAVMQLQQAPSGLLRITSPIEFGQMFLASLLGDFSPRGGGRRCRHCRATGADLCGERAQRASGAFAGGRAVAGRRTVCGLSFAAFPGDEGQGLPRFPDQPPAGRHRSFTGAGGGPPDNIAPLNFRFNFRLARESP